MLLQRESRYLEPTLRAQVDAQFSRIIDEFVRRARHESPALDDEDARLLVTAAMAVLSTPATMRPVLPRAEYRRELSSAALLCLRFDISAVTPAPTPPDTNAAEETTQQSGRRDDIVDAAIKLFYLSGYPGVSLDDIGAAVGMAGPSLFHYFETKSDILVAAFDRAIATLADQRMRLRSTAAGVAEFVDTHVRFCLGNRDLVGVYVSDAVSLPADALERTRSIIRRDIADWTAALQAETDGLSERQARVRVQAAMSAIHDLVRLGHFASRPAIAEETDALAQAILRR